MITTILVLARTLHIGSAMLLVALPWFILVILKPLDGDSDFDGFCHDVGRWLWAAWVTEIITGLVWFWFVAAQMSDQSPWSILALPDLGTVLEQTQFGRLWVGRAMLELVVGVMLYCVSRRKNGVAMKHGWMLWCLCGISSVLLVTLAWAGHAVSGVQFHLLHLVADALHLLIGAIWPIGLIPLLCLLRRVGAGDRTVSVSDGIVAAQRFSRSSFLAVLILVATGIINGWLMVGSWEALVTTIYGRLLLGKLFFVGLMILIGAFNRFFILRRIDSPPMIFRALKKTILAETVLTVIVLLIVGIMGTTAPPLQ